MPVQTAFPETIRQGIPGMVNRMVDFNTVTRSCATAAGIAPSRAVSQGTSDIDAVVGGTLVGFLGFAVLDPTLVVPSGQPVDSYPQYANMCVLTKGEMFATAAVGTTAGDPVHFGAADGVLTNTGAVGPIVGARWKYTRLAGELNAVQLGIQR